MNNELMINTIKELCKTKDITVTGLEEALGFSQGLIGRWKDKSPSLDRICDIADYFGVSIDYLVGRTIIIFDPFLDALYNMTNNKSLRWERLKSYDSHIKITKTIDYDEDKYNEIYYYALFDSGYIIVRCFSEHNKTIKPIELNVYVQPSLEDAVYQDYQTEQLLPLWILILSKVKDIPKDIIAENMKQKLINKNQLGAPASFLDKNKTR